MVSLTVTGFVMGRSTASREEGYQHTGLLTKLCDPKSANGREPTLPALEDWGRCFSSLTTSAIRYPRDCGRRKLKRGPSRYAGSLPRRGRGNLLPHKEGEILRIALLLSAFPREIEAQGGGVHCSSAGPLAVDHNREEVAEMGVGVHGTRLQCAPTRATDPPACECFSHSSGLVKLGQPVAQTRICREN